MLICFEGPEGSGKTTLIKRLCEEDNLPLWERPKEIEKFKEEQGHYDLFVLNEMSILRCIDWTKNDLVVDRHPIVSEWVYSTLYERPSKVPKGDLSLFSEGTCFIFLRRQWKDELKNLEQALYDAAMCFVARKFPVLILRTDEESIDACFYQIDFFLSEVKYPCIWRCDYA